LFYYRIKLYFEQLLGPHPDIIIPEADTIIKKTRSNKEMFRFTLWYLTKTYGGSKNMYSDLIFVHLVEKYYMTNQAFWVTPIELDKIINKAKESRHLMIGETAPNLIMQDTSDQIVDLHSIKVNYTLLFFWDPDCDHCLLEVPKLVKFYNEAKESLGLEVYAVSTDTDYDRWKKFIRENKLKWYNVTDKYNQTNFREIYDVITTPDIFLVDKDKKIIIKGLDADQTIKFFYQYLERLK